jgi:hypothetical protein
VVEGVLPVVEGVLPVVEGVLPVVELVETTRSAGGGSGMQ